MTEETIDQSVEEVEAVEQTETDEVQTDDVPEDQAESDNADETESDDEEVEYEGNKYKVPKELKDALLRQSDYTRKTQEVATQRQELERQQAEFQQRSQSQQQHIQDFAQLHAMDAELARYREIDWDALTDQDPVQALKLDRQYRMLNETRQGIVQRIQETEARQDFERQRNYAKAIETGQEVLKREIPNWSADKAKEIREFAVNELKIDKRVIENLLDPQAVLALHYAKIGYQSLKQAAQKPKPSAEAKPVQKVSSKRDTAQINPDRLNADEWLKWREKQLRKS